MNRVSTGLLETILDKRVYWICDGSPENKIGYSSDCEASVSKRAGYNINTYEFMHMCKQYVNRLDEWIIESGIDYANVFGRYSCGDDGPLEVFSGDTEVDAVIAATEWIMLQNKKGK